MSTQQILTQAQVEAYLSRMGIEEVPSPTLDTLNQLILAHQLAIPFETVDITGENATPVLTIEAVYHRVVTLGRGGYCFELNLLFTALLKALGYAVRTVVCRVVLGRTERAPLQHRAALVFIEGNTYYADVGFSRPLAAGALLFEHGLEQCVQGEYYRLLELNDCWWALERCFDKEHCEGIPAEPRIELEICLAAMEEQDFLPLNLYSSRPGTVLHDSILANIRTETGSCYLKDDLLKIWDKGRVSEISLANEEQLKQALLEYFGIAV